MIISAKINGKGETPQDVFGLTQERVAELDDMTAKAWNSTPTEMETVQKVVEAGLTAEELCYAIFSVGLQSGYHYANRNQPE